MKCFSTRSRFLRASESEPSEDERVEKQRDLARREHGSHHVLDLGTGGGFPLLPLAILFPEISFTGLDATKKKAEAVRRIVNKIGLTNVDLLIGRAEELGHDPLQREQYDVVLSRATAPLPTLLEFMSSFVKVYGHLLCWKSMHIADELLASIPARMALQVRLVDTVEYDLPGDWGKRQILVFEKTGKLAGKYPRGVGIPKTKPLT